jgi:cytochrome c oxidase cbb3-type subunit 3
MLAGCERETRNFESGPLGAQITPTDAALAIPRVAKAERNAYSLASGKRLWTWYNCAGCHAQGGGGSGPSLMTNIWAYGGDAPTLYRTIAEGRPNGMPAYGGRIPNDQIWQLAAYVRSLAAIAPQDAAPNRDDAFLTRTPESFMDQQKELAPIRAPASGASR